LVVVIYQLMIARKPSLLWYWTRPISYHYGSLLW